MIRLLKSFGNLSIYFLHKIIIFIRITSLIFGGVLLDEDGDLFIDNLWLNNLVQMNEDEERNSTSKIRIL